MLVSVLMAVYNGAGTVDEAMGSILAQSFRDWELIVVDDGSTDDTRKRLERYDDPRIRVLYNAANSGLSASLNVAFRASTGSLIARMDADDVALPHRLQRQVEFLRVHPEIDVVGGAATLLGSDAIYERHERHEQMTRLLFTENPFIHPTVMMRRNFLETLGGYDESIQRAEDYDLWLRGVTRFRYYNIQEPLIQYRAPTRATWKQARDAGRTVWRHGLRAGTPLRGAYGALRYTAAFVLWRLGALFR